MRRVRFFLVASVIGGTLAWSASAAPPGGDDEDDDDNMPRQTAPAAPNPTPSPMPATSSPPSGLITPIQPVQPPPTQPLVTPTSPTSAVITMSPGGGAGAGAAAPYGGYRQPAAAQPLATIAPAPMAPQPPDPKIAELGAGVDRVRAAFDTHNQQIVGLHQQRSTIALGYYRDTGDINSRLATGAVPNDPTMLGELARARQSLDTLQGNTNQLNAMSSALTDDASSILSLAQQIHTELDVPGKSASDRGGLALVEGKITSAQADIDQTLRNVLGELARENQSIATERQTLDLLGREIAVGAFLSDSAAGARGGAVSTDAPPAPEAVVASTGARPLVVISRDMASGSYERKLYAAVSSILKRAPSASFTVQATTPGRASGATRALDASDVQRKADEVARSLSTFGLPRARIIETASSDEAVNEPQVQVFAGSGSTMR